MAITERELPVATIPRHQPHSACDAPRAVRPTTAGLFWAVALLWSELTAGVCALLAASGIDPAYTDRYCSGLGEESGRESVRTPPEPGVDST